MCVKDPSLLKISRMWWYKLRSRKDKKTEVRRTIMTDMRRLATLYIHMKKSEEILGKLPESEGNISDLFR